MSKQVSLAAQPRPGTGKEVASKLRREGRVPAIVYGTGVEPTPISVDALELYHALHTGAGTNAVMRLEVEGAPHLAFAREIQRHPVRREVMHVDFVTIDRTHTVTIDVPVVLEGEPVAVTEGGVLSQEAHTLSVDVLPLEVPDQIIVDVSGLDATAVLRAGDVPLPAGVTLLSDAEMVVAVVSMPTTEEEEPGVTGDAAEAAAEGATADAAEG